MGFIGTLEDGNWHSLAELHTNGDSPANRYASSKHMFAGRLWVFHGNVDPYAFRDLETGTQVGTFSGTDRASPIFYRDRCYVGHFDNSGGATAERTFRIDRVDLPGLARTQVYSRDYGIIDPVDFPVLVLSQYAPWSGLMYFAGSANEENAGQGLGACSIVEFDPEAETAVELYFEGSASSKREISGLGVDDSFVYFHQQDGDATVTYSRRTVVPQGGSGQTPTITASSSSANTNTQIGRAMNYGLWLRGVETIIRDHADATTWTLTTSSGGATTPTIQPIGPTDGVNAFPIDLLVQWQTSGSVAEQVDHVTLNAGGSVTTNADIMPGLNSGNTTSSSFDFGMNTMYATPSGSNIAGTGPEPQYFVMTTSDDYAVVRLRRRKTR